MQLLVFDHYGLPFWVNMAVTMFFVWLYTQQGGVKSLIWTDTLKTVCLVGSVVLCIVFIVRESGLTFPAALEAVRQSPYSEGSSSSTIPVRRTISGRCSGPASSRSSP